MAVSSAMLPLGTQLPEFSLPDVVTGAPFSSTALRGKPALLMVLCNHCPYVVRIKSDIARLSGQFLDRGVRVVALSANDAAKYPADSPEQMKADAQVFAYLISTTRSKRSPLPSARCARRSSIFSEPTAS